MLSKELTNNKIFGFFEKISEIPRGSGNEEAISCFLEEFAKNRGLFYIRDKANNIIIKKGGTKGYENSPAVILQGHMDMVCEKEEVSDHNFLADPIELMVVDGCLTANGTTLGGDNGIAVSYCLALLDSDDIPHPPLEIVITTDEETGMTGAYALDTSVLSAKKLINIDSEEEGYLLVSCCGGRRATVTIPVERAEFKASVTLKVAVGGLKGGHSGSDIHLQRANANKLLGRVLKELYKAADIRLVSVKGGNVDNAITRDSFAIIAVKADKETAAVNTAGVLEELLRSEYKGIEDTVDINVKPEKGEYIPMTEDASLKVIRAIELIPYGVHSMCANIDNLVETSSNLGIIRTDEKSVTLSNSVRSSVATRKDLICSMLDDIAALCGGSLDMRADYPGWEFNPDSELLKLFKATYVDMYNKEPVVMAMHAGLECGLFAEKMKGVDMISLGPDMWDVHTPQERLSISSVLSTWEYLKAVLKNMR